MPEQVGGLVWEGGDVWGHNQRKSSRDRRAKRSLYRRAYSLKYGLKHFRTFGATGMSFRCILRDLPEKCRIHGVGLLRGDRRKGRRGGVDIRSILAL